MKKFLAALVTLACALCVFLVGCGGSSAGEPESYDAAFVGTWEAVEMSGDMTYDKEQMEAFRSIGLIDMFINLDEGGKAVICSSIGDNVSSVETTWKAESATQVTLASNTGEQTMELENNMLSLSGDGTTIRFEKVEHRDALPITAEVAADSASDAAGDVAAQEAAAAAAAETLGGVAGASNEAEKASSEAAAISSEAAAGGSESAAAASSNAASSGESASSSEAAQSASGGTYEVSIDGVEVGADYNGAPALIVTYTWKNNSDKTTSYAASLMAKCFQNGVQLDIAFVMDGIDSDGYMAEVRPGYGTTFQMAYELGDTENPVEIEVSELYDFNGGILASKTFDIK